jgi:hypothetical protein
VIVPVVRFSGVPGGGVAAAIVAVVRWGGVAGTATVPVVRWGGVGGLIGLMVRGTETGAEGFGLIGLIVRGIETGDDDVPVARTPARAETPSDFNRPSCASLMPRNTSLDIRWISVDIRPKRAG